MHIPVFVQRQLLRYGIRLAARTVDSTFKINRRLQIQRIGKRLSEPLIFRTLGETRKLVESSRLQALSEATVAGRQLNGARDLSAVRALLERANQFLLEFCADPETHSDEQVVAYDELIKRWDQGLQLRSAKSGWIGDFIAIIDGWPNERVLPLTGPPIESMFDELNLFELVAVLSGYRDRLRNLAGPRNSRFAEEAVASL